MSLQSKIMDFLGPRPGLVILRVHQGKVEIILRVILIVLVFFTFVCGAFLLTHLKPSADFPADVPADVLELQERITREFADTRTGCQWIIFVCWMAIAVQAVSLTLRFLNLTVVERYIGPVLLVGIILHALFLISWFAAAILFAVHSAHWQRLRKDCENPDNKATCQLVPISTIMSAVAGTSCFCFFVLFCEIVLTIWIVMWLVLRWQHLVTQQLRYQPGPSQGDEEDWVPEED